MQMMVPHSPISLITTIQRCYLQCFSSEDTINSCLTEQTSDSESESQESNLHSQDGFVKPPPAPPVSSMQSARYQKAITNVEEEWGLKVKVSGFEGQGVCAEG